MLLPRLIVHCFPATEVQSELAPITIDHHKRINCQFPSHKLSRFSSFFFSSFSHLRRLIEFRHVDDSDRHVDHFRDYFAWNSFPLFSGKKWIIQFLLKWEISKSTWGWNEKLLVNRKALLGWRKFCELNDGDFKIVSLCDWNARKFRWKILIEARKII